MGYSFQDHALPDVKTKDLQLISVMIEKCSSLKLRTGWLCTKYKNEGLERRDRYKLSEGFI